MKKTFSIFFLTLFLFNVGGYHLVFLALRYQADQKLKFMIDAGDYSKDQTLELKVALSMPYPLHPRGAQRVNGEFEINGEYFTLVEQSFHNDTLHVVLIRDVHEEHLLETMTSYANLSNDLPASTQKAFNMLGKLLKDYNTSPAITLSETVAWQTSLISYHEFVSTLLSANKEITSPPPRA